MARSASSLTSFGKYFSVYFRIHGCEGWNVVDREGKLTRYASYIKFLIEFLGFMFKRLPKNSIFESIYFCLKIEINFLYCFYSELAGCFFFFVFPKMTYCLTKYSIVRRRSCWSIILKKAIRRIVIGLKLLKKITFLKRSHLKRKELCKKFSVLNYIFWLAPSISRF